MGLSWLGLVAIGGAEAVAVRVARCKLREEGKPGIKREKGRQCDEAMRLRKQNGQPACIKRSRSRLLGNLTWERHGYRCVPQAITELISVFVPFPNRSGH